MCAFRDEELDFSTECWLEAHDRTQVFSNVNGEWKDIIQLSDDTVGDCSWNNVKIVTCYTSEQPDILAKLQETEESNFDIYSYGIYMVMIRR